MGIPPGSIRGISFDYGHVLGGLDLEALAQRVAAPDAVSTMRAAMPLAYRLHDEAIARGLGHEAGWRALMGALVEAAGIADRIATIDALWNAQPSRNLWRFVPDDARTLLADLTQAGVAMVITSNSEGRVRELLEEVGIAHHFIAILDSGVLGFAKPDGRMFELAAKALEITLETMVHVGDSEAADIVGAKRVGARAIRYDGFVPGSADRPTEADARAATFDELRAHLFAALASVR